MVQGPKMNCGMGYSWSPLQVGEGCSVRRRKLSAAKLRQGKGCLGGVLVRQGFR